MNDEAVDPHVAEAMDMVRSVLPVYVVAESPDGKILSHDDGYPTDDTQVWKQTIGSDDNPVPLGELYAEYGSDLIAYAEPEETSVTASIGEPLPILDSDDDVTPVAPETVPEHVSDPAETAAATAALEEIETFLDTAEAALDVAAVTAGLETVPHRTLLMSTMRKAAGGNPEAQAEIVTVFERNNHPDLNTFIRNVVGERPAEDDQHDEVAWDHVAAEARLWHAKQLAVTASMRTTR